MRWSEHPDKAHESKVDKSTQVMVLSYSPSRNSFTYTPRNIETVTLLHIQAKEDRRSHIPSQQVSLNMEDGLSMRKRRFSWRAKGGLVKEPRLKKKKKTHQCGRHPYTFPTSLSPIHSWVWPPHPGKNSTTKLSCFNILKKVFHNIYVLPLQKKNWISMIYLSSIAGTDLGWYTGGRSIHLLCVIWNGMHPQPK